MAGLLRDIGKRAMDQLIGAEEMQPAFVGAGPKVSQIELENSTFGVGHAEIGAALGEMWGLPRRSARCCAGIMSQILRVRRSGICAMLSTAVTRSRCGWGWVSEMTVSAIPFHHGRAPRWGCAVGWWRST